MLQRKRCVPFRRTTDFGGGIKMRPRRMDGAPLIRIFYKKLTVSWQFPIAFLLNQVRAAIGPETGWCPVRGGKSQKCHETIQSRSRVDDPGDYEFSNVEYSMERSRGGTG